MSIVIRSDPNSASTSVYVSREISDAWPAHTIQEYTRDINCCRLGYNNIGTRRLGILCWQIRIDVISRLNYCIEDLVWDYHVGWKVRIVLHNFFFYIQ